MTSNSAPVVSRVLPVLFPRSPTLFLDERNKAISLLASQFVQGARAEALAHYESMVNEVERRDCILLVWQRREGEGDGEEENAKIMGYEPAAHC